MYNMYFGRYCTSMSQCSRASCCPHHDGGKDNRLNWNTSMYLLNHMVSQTQRTIILKLSIKKILTHTN